MRIALQVSGREMTFSEKKLTAILEKYFSSEVNWPTEGEWFEVNPQAIDQTLFQEARSNWRQEKTRQLILEAFEKVNGFPKTYGKIFETMMPEKNWTCKTVRELKLLAYEIGDHNANWVEQALEWAQRIHNGELWEDVCNRADTANWRRVIVWKNGYWRRVGGSRRFCECLPASIVETKDLNSDSRIDCAVPLIVRYK